MGKKIKYVFYGIYFGTGERKTVATLNWLLARGVCHLSNSDTTKLFLDKTGWIKEKLARDSYVSVYVLALFSIIGTDVDWENEMIELPRNEGATPTERDEWIGKTAIESRLFKEKIQNREKYMVENGKRVRVGAMLMDRSCL